MNVKKVFFLLFFLFLLLPKSAFASDFRTNYEVHYYPQKEGTSILSQVKYHITITNLKPDLYIKEYTVSFPQSFQVMSLETSDNDGILSSSIKTEGKYTAIVIPLRTEKIGVNETNELYISFTQSNLFKEHGSTWEVIIPTMQYEEGDTYKVLVHMPPDYSKNISIAKPKPDYIRSDQIEWTNPKQKTIYAIFGSTQNYQLKLTYHLTNPQISRVYMDVAFPPDTLYQKTYVHKIDPEPNLVYMDSDGNYIGRYFLSPKETKTVQYISSMTLFPQPRQEMKDVVNTQYIDQKHYLLSENNLWRSIDSADTQNLKDVKSIYQFVLNTLDYDFGRVSTSTTRLGSVRTLQNPTQAVCTEYSDLFIALAREKGIPARELQGYGISSENEIRPISLDGDILHSWVEFYDTNSKLWIPIDPTWEDTSHIDYFNSLDFNHIVFAIHGKKADYPYPAGSYKDTKETKDIEITPLKETPVESTKIESTINQNIVYPISNNKTLITLLVKNKSNVFLWNTPIILSSNQAKVWDPKQMIFSLAPYEEKKLQFYITVPESLTYQKELKLNAKIGSMSDFDYTVTYIAPLSKQVIFLFIFVVIIGIVILLIIKRHKNSYP